MTILVLGSSYLKHIISGIHSVLGLLNTALDAGNVMEFTHLEGDGSRPVNTYLLIIPEIPNCVQSDEAELHVMRVQGEVSF